MKCHFVRMDFMSFVQLYFFPIFLLFFVVNENTLYFIKIYIIMHFTKENNSCFLTPL